METTEYDLYDLLIGDDDISAIGDGSVTGAIASLDTSITNITPLSGTKSGVTVNNHSSTTVTVTHNFGRANNVVANIILTNSSAYTWAGLLISVWDMQNNSFKATIYNNSGSNGTFSFNWIAVAI